MDMTIDEIIGHCNRTCEMAEMVANERGQTQDDITSKRYWEHYHVAKYLEELKRMKDAEEQGLLLRLPCPIGTTVYNTIWWDDKKRSYKGRRRNVLQDGSEVQSFKINIFTFGY